jgi:uncharacterized protein
MVLLFALSGCTQSKPVSLASSSTPPPGNAATAGEGSEVRDPPPLLEFPKAGGFVNDFAGVLAEKDEQDLEAALRKLQERAKIDFAIALVETTGEKNIFDYSLAMAKEWKVGSENGGILLVVAVTDRKWHIQVTRGLENGLSDAEVKKIGDLVVPDFKNKKYGAGIKKCVNKMIAELARKQGFEPFTVE